MAPLIFLPSQIWLKRTSLVLASLLAGLSALVLLGWATQTDLLVQLWPGQATVKPNVALCFLLFGLTVLAFEFDYREAGWLAWIAAVIGALTLVEYWGNPGWSIDELLAHDYLPIEVEAPGRMVPAAAVCLLAAGSALGWMANQRASSARNLYLAFVGSAITSVGVSTLIGYMLDLPAVYRWGTGTSLAPGSALLFIALGLCQLSLAWREHQSGQPGAPTWLPMPVMVASITLTLILWLGLREREEVYIGVNTQAAVRAFASSIKLEIERANAGLERLSRRWAEGGAENTAAQEAEGRAFSSEVAGCVAVTRLSAQGRTDWMYPDSGHGVLLFLDQTSNPLRKAALDAARHSGSAAMSATLARPGGVLGFAIFAPIVSHGSFVGYVGGEFNYRPFFRTLEQRARLANDYAVSVFVGRENVFENDPSAGRPIAHRIEEIFGIADRRVRVELAPTEANADRNRRPIPELALSAGLGISLLLGLSVHLARAARTGLRNAELSNRRLIEENEERRRIEAKLKTSDERLRLALDSTQIGIFEWHLPSNEIYYSDGVWAMLGYPPRAFPATQEAWTSLIHPLDLPAYRSSVEKQLGGGAEFIDPEYRVRTADGEWRWLYARSRAVSVTTSGTPARIIGTLQDVTVRKRSEDALRLSQATTRKLSLVASKTDNIVIIGSPSGTIEWVNESFERIMEYRLEEVVGKNPATFMVGPETKARTVRMIKAAMRRGQGISTDVVNYSKSGKKYHVHLEVQPILNEAGALENFIAIEADISERVETEQTLRRAKAEADAASRAKSEFLASMSHEIRTPMNGVIGMTSLLLDTQLAREQRDYVNTIRTSGEALLTIINDILDFSKIESGKMELERLPFELAVCIEDAFDLFSVAASAKKLELVYFIENSVPPWVQGDVTRIRQVLVNLINNAVKFTPAGMISIHVRQISEPANLVGAPVTLEFAVSDTGIGIPAERADRLFRPFSQVDSSTTRKYGGTGLGLAICHRLCTLMGGSISAASTVGVGSTFSFTIVVESVITPPGWGLPECPARFSYGPILCLEDNPISQKRLTTFLRSWGGQIEEFDEPARLATRLTQEPRPVAAVVDFQLLESPEGENLRSNLLASDLPLLILLPPGNSSQHAQAFSGRRAVAVVIKPLRTQSLVRNLQSLFDAPPDSLPPFSIPAENKLLARELPLNVLLVEDNPVNQKVALRFLDRLGYRADAVGNGLEAVNTLEARSYDLVLMDLQMPEMDGFEATRQIRQRLPLDHQPKIIALTANAMQGDRDLCVAAGMDDYITKPVKLRDIADAIRRQFSSDTAFPGIEN